MTEENKKQNIRVELERAEEARRAAELVFGNALLRDAVSRLYYCLFYTVRALLLSIGLEPKSRERALKLFSLHFVKDEPCAC